MRTDGTFRSNRERRFIRQQLKLAKGNNGTSFLPDSLAWDAMIRDAKKRIEDLKLSIAQFEKKKAAGERWPEGQSEERGAARQHTVYGSRQFPAS